MPRGSPFTALCQAASQSPRIAADLHAHTVASDGDWTAEQLVVSAIRAGLSFLAITDHDTMAAVPLAVAAASRLPGPKLEVVAGVEISASYAGHEVHMLAYFVPSDHVELNRALASIRESRRQRFWAWVELFPGLAEWKENGLIDVEVKRADSLGRRHLAKLLVRSGVAPSLWHAFSQHLGPMQDRVPPKRLIPALEAIRLVRQAGGVIGVAHPSERLEEADFRHLAAEGLQAVEVNFPRANGRSGRLRELAERCGLAVTGGSDFHSAGSSNRAIGACGISLREFNSFHDLAAECHRNSSDR